MNWPRTRGTEQASHPRLSVRVLTVLILVLAFLFSTALLGAGEPAHADEPDDALGEVTIAVTDMTPTMVGEDDTVKVTVRVANNSPDPVNSARLSLSIVRYKLSSPRSLTTWFTGVADLVRPTFLTSVDLETELGAGQERTLTLEVPANDLRLLPYPDAAGPRGLIVTLQDLPSGREIDSFRTFLLWFPDANLEPVRMSILTPITGPTPTPLTPTAWQNRIALETRKNARLDRLLAATGDHKGVTWVVDPALVEAASESEPHPSSAADNAEWAERLLTSATGREVFALNPFDPDVAALAHAGIEPFLTSPAETVPPAITNWRNDLTLPPNAVVDLETAEAGVVHGRKLILVASGLAPTETIQHPHRASTATIPTGAGPATALLPDPELSAMFAAPDITTTGSIFGARQLLLAHLASIRVEDATEPVHLLLTTGRDWLPDGADTSFILDGLEDASFVDLEPLSRLLGAPINDIDRTPLPALVPDADGAISARDLNLVQHQAEHFHAVASTTPVPSELIGPYLEAMAATTAVQWRTNPSARPQQLSAVRNLGESLTSSLSVVPGSTVNLISDRGDLPVTVSNDLLQDATIGIRLSPNDRRLQTDEVVTVTIPAESATLVNIPATAIGSGDVEVGVQLLGPDGQELNQSSFIVRVRADWENTGTAVLAALLVIALILGVIRTIRRGKKPTRMDPVTAPSSNPGRSTS